MPDNSFDILKACDCGIVCARRELSQTILTGKNTYKSLRVHISSRSQCQRNRAAVPEKSYRNPEIGENLQVRLASYLGLSYRMFLTGNTGSEGPNGKKIVP